MYDYNTSSTQCDGFCIISQFNKAPWGIQHTQHDLCLLKKLHKVHLYETTKQNQEQWEECRVLFSQPQVMNCHQKCSVTEKQFSASLQLPPPTLIQKVNKKRKRKCSPTTSDLKCFCSHIWGHFDWQEKGKSVLVSFPSLERKKAPSKGRKTEAWELYWWWWWWRWLWNPSVTSRLCTQTQQWWQRHTSKKEVLNWGAK